MAKIIPSLLISLVTISLVCTDLPHRPDSLYEALKKQDPKVIRLLLEQKDSNPNIYYGHRYNTYPLFMARTREIAQLLVEGGADLLQHNWLGYSLLHHTIDPSIEDDSLFDYYVEQGLDPSLLPDKGATLWHQLLASARWYPAQRIEARAKKLRALNVPEHTMHPDSGFTPEQLVTRQLKQVQGNFDPKIFGQARGLIRLLRIFKR